MDLSTNFRSAPAIVEWVNSSFASIFPNRDDRTRGQVCYRPSTAQKSVNPKSFVQISGFITAEQEAQAIAESIQEQLSSSDTQNIAILVRARTHLKFIVEALKSRDIPWQAKNIEPLGQRMHVLDMHSLVRLLHSSGDRIAWLSFLRSPMLGLDMNSLYALATGESECIWQNIQNPQSISALDTTTQARLTAFASLISSTHAQLGLTDLRTLVANLWQQLGGKQSLFKSSHQQDLDDYLDLLESQTTGNLIFDLESFEEELGQLYARPDSSADCPLKIMTVHAAKGLEFDHVYLPQIQRSTAGMQQNPALVWQEREYADGHTAFLAAAKPARNTSDPLYAWLLADEREKVQDESARLLYVACTRAKQSLHISGLVKWDEKKENWKAPVNNSLMALLWTAYEEDFCSELDQNQISQQEDQVRELTGIRRLKTNTKATESLPGFESNSKIQQEQKQKNTAPLLLSFAENLIQRTVGDLLHYCLMETAQGQAKSAEDYQQDWDWKLRLSGLSETDQSEALQRLQRGFANATKTEFGQWVLNPNHKESACELEIEQLLPSGSLALSIVDRTFIAAESSINGSSSDSDPDKQVRWIIDYKSATPKDGQTEQDFFDSQEEKYRNQLSRYRALFSDELPIKTLLYFPAANLHHEVFF